MYEPDIFQTTRRFGTVLENVDLDPRTRELDLDSERFTENTRGAYPLALHRQRRPDRGRRPAAQRGVPDRRRVRGHAADLAAHPRAGRLPLHQRLHRQAGGHRGRGQGADGDLLGLLRRPVHAAPPGALRGDADGAARALRRARLAGQHRLDRRSVRHRRADEHRPHPFDGPGGDRRAARRRADADRPDLRVRGPARVPRRAGVVPRPARDVGGPGRVRPAGRGRWPGCSRPTSTRTRGWSRPGSSPQARSPRRRPWRRRDARRRTARSPASGDRGRVGQAGVAAAAGSSSAAVARR